MKNTLIALMMFVLLFSCETDVDMDLGPHTPVLVVHGFVSTGDFFKISVSKTTNSKIVNVDELIVDNATVILYENDIARDTIPYDPFIKRYASLVIAVPGNTYKIVVQAPGFTTVEATAVASPEVATTIKSYEKNARSDVDGSLLNDIVFSIADPASQPNHYYVEISGTLTGYFCTYTFDPSVEQFQGSLNPFEPDDCIGSDEILITDKRFNGIVKDVAISATAWAMEEFDNGNRMLRPYLTKYTVSEEYYNYLRDGIAADLFEGNPFAEPRITKGNVRNGYGLFAVYSVTVDTLR
jgi:hypothetical protein